MRGESKRSSSNSDRNKVAANQPHELRYIAQKFNVTEDDVKKAIQAVGNSRKKVEEYLQNIGRRS